MDSTEVKMLLMHEARKRGICLPGLKQMRCNNIDELIDYYLQHPDWCLERNYPDFKTLNDVFSDCEDKGVYVGKTFNGEVFDKLQTYIFHNCKGTIKVAMDYDNAVIPMLYFANGCNITVSCDQENVPPIKVPIYETEEWANVVNTTLSNNCEFKRYPIKIIEV